MSVSCFVSDIHLGLDYKDPKAREAKFVSFLEQLPSNLTDLFLLGDIFDFWYEYKNVIPNKFTRTLGALAKLSDRGVRIHYFNGNHDIWTYRYFQNELGIEILDKPKIFELNGKRFFLGHGDGILDDSKGYKFLKGIFTNKFIQFCFSALHPRWAFLFGNNWSKHNRLTHTMSEKEFAELKSNITERALQWCAEYQKNAQNERIDYFILGHYHIPIRTEVEGGEFFMLSDWIHHPDYILFDESGLTYLSY